VRTSTRSIALAAVLSVLVMLPAAYYWPIEDPYHPSNVGWNGCSEIASNKNATLLQSYNQELPTNSTLVIIGPSLPYSVKDSTIIGNYLRSRGTVLLADDFGSGNSLLEELNVSARFAGKPLADLYAYSKGPAFPLANVFSNSSVLDNASVVILDHPSFLDIGDSSQVTVLASSSPFSFIDLQGNGKPVQNESVRSYPVIAYVHVGAGSLVLISDASMFINEMIGLYDNSRLFASILKIGGGSLLFDVAHLSHAPLTNMRLAIKDYLGGLARFARANIYLQAGLVVLIFALSLPFHLVRRVRRRKATVEFYTSLNG
jgi:hypothetical protein